MKIKCSQIYFEKRICFRKVRREKKFIICFEIMNDKLICDIVNVTNIFLEKIKPNPYINLIFRGIKSNQNTLFLF